MHQWVESSVRYRNSPEILSKFKGYFPYKTPMMLLLDKCFTLKSHESAHSVKSKIQVLYNMYILWILKWTCHSYLCDFKLTLLVLNIFVIISHVVEMIPHGKQRPFDPVPSIHGWWSPGDARSQGISSHVIDINIRWYSDFSIKWVRP